MLSDADRERLSHILDAIEKISLALQDTDFDDFSADWQKQLVIERLLEIIGEAARQTSDETKQRHTDVQWHKMIGMRNVLTHEYFRIDRATLWKTATESAPSLRPQVEQILTAEQSE